MIYLDYQSTTPCDPRVVEAMSPYWANVFGNPHSSHGFGVEAQEAIESARSQIATLIHAEPKDIIFTSGATEANNLAIKGIASFYKNTKNHIITVKTEHKCILESCRYLEQEGFDITYLGVDRDGLIDLDELQKAITPKTILVSIMAVNNEIGVIQPLQAIGSLCRQHNVFFHTDAAQALGKIDLDVNAMNIDLMSLSAHKIYGPKGIGALYVRRHNPRVKLKAQINGGGQERGMRSGTLPTPLCVGFGKACEIMQKEMHEESKRIQSLTTMLREGLVSEVSFVSLNGHPTKRIPGNLNLSFAFVEGEALMGLIPHIAVSSGSACTSSSLEPSYVLKALNIQEDLIHTSLRFGIGRFTTKEEIQKAIDDIIKAVKQLREMSPLYEMELEGIDIQSIAWKEH